MTTFKPVLELPTDNLGERRRLLEEDLRQTIEVQTTTSLKKDLIELFRKFELEGDFTVTWDFYPESDDEGGSYMCICDVTIESATDSDFSADEIHAEIPYRWGSGSYEAQLDDEVREFLSEDSSDIYEINMESISITVQKGE